jgi:hypothetical protein
MSPFVMRQGRRIEVVPLDTGHTPKRRRKPFEAQFVQVPKRWVEALSQTKSVGTYRLALVILAKEFERQHTGREIVLSAQVTRMAATTRQRAAQELISLGLIQLETPNGKRAPRVLVVREI